MVCKVGLSEHLGLKLNIKEVHFSTRIILLILNEKINFCSEWDYFVFFRHFFVKNRTIKLCNN
jgi:hypothetical protein